MIKIHYIFTKIYVLSKYIIKSLQNHKNALVKILTLFTKYAIIKTVMNMNERKVPKATLQRYPIYLKALRRMQKYGQTRVMSKELSEQVNIEPTTIRRDFSLLGNLGKQGYGYDVEALIEIFNQQLGVDFDEKIILLGAGNLGRALMKYNKWDHVVGEITCAFDVNQDRQGVRFGIPVYDMEELEEKIPEGCRVAILAIGDNVQKTVDRLIACGIIGIIDFTHKSIKVPKHVTVKTVDVVASIQEMVFEINNMEKNQK